MATAKYLELAVILRAVDQMSGTVRNALGGTTNGYKQLQNSQEKAQAAMSRGLTMGSGAAAGLAMLKKFVHGYGDVDEAERDLRASLMQPGGYIDEKLFARLQKMDEYLSSRYAGSQMDYVNMVRLMKQNKLDPKDILGGIGEDVAQLSELFKTAPAASAVFAARVKNDMRVPVSEMKEMIDLMVRLRGIGVGGVTGSGEEAIANMTEFYSKAGLGASNLGLTGTKHAKELGLLGAMYIAKGLDAPSVGTTFRRIFDNIANPEKMKKMNEEAAKFGIHLNFFDKKGKFKGIDNFVAQISTLKGLSDQAAAQILGPAGSAQGMSGDVLRNLARYASEDYPDFKQRAANQGTLEQQVAEQQKGQNQQARVAATNIDNMVAAIGKGYNPAVMSAIKLTQEWSNSITHFTREHTRITGFVEGFAGLAVGGMAVGSAFNFLKAGWFYSGMNKLWALTGLGRGLGVVGTVLKELGYGVAILARSIGTSLVASITSLGTASAAAIGGIVAGTAVLGYLAFKGANKASAMIKEGDAQNAKWMAQDAADRVAHPEWYKPGKPGKAQVLPKYKGQTIDIRELTPKLKSDMQRNGAAQQAPTLHYAPQITIQGNASPDHIETINRLMAGHKSEIMNMMRRDKGPDPRLAF